MVSRPRNNMPPGIAAELRARRAQQIKDATEYRRLLLHEPPDLEAIAAVEARMGEYLAWVEHNVPLPGVEEKNNAPGGLGDSGSH